MLSDRGLYFPRIPGDSQPPPSLVARARSDYALRFAVAQDVTPVRGEKQGSVLWISGSGAPAGAGIAGSGAPSTLNASASTSALNKPKNVLITTTTTNRLQAKGDSDPLKVILKVASKTKAYVEFCVFDVR